MDNRGRSGLSGRGGLSPIESTFVHFVHIYPLDKLQLNINMLQ